MGEKEMEGKIKGYMRNTGEKIANSGAAAQEQQRKT